MEYIVPGVCGLLVIIGLVAIIFSRRNWRAFQMVLMFFILIGSLFFFYLAARTLATQREYAKETRDFEQKIRTALEGTPGNPTAPLGVKQYQEEQDRLKLDVATVLADRGRVWHGAVYKSVAPGTGVITAVIEQPSPHGLENKIHVFVFEEKEIEHGGQYLGEFVVKNAKETTLELWPRPNISQPELNRIRASRGPWSIYEIMPIDNHEAFADLDQAGIKALLPEASREEYLHDGKPAEGNDPPERVWYRVKFVKDYELPDKDAALVPPAAAADNAAAGGPGNAPGKLRFKAGDTAMLNQKTAQELIDAKPPVAELVDKQYMRGLRDYARLFREAYRQQDVLFASNKEIEAQDEKVKNALAQVNDDIKACQMQKDNLTKDLAKFQSERDVVVAFVKSLEKVLGETLDEKAAAEQANQQLNSRLIDAQRKQAEFINRQPRAAQADAAPPG